MVVAVKQTDRVFETGLPKYVGEKHCRLEDQIHSSSESIYVLSELKTSIHGMSKYFQDITRPFRKLVFKHSESLLGSSSNSGELRDSIIVLSDLIRFLTTLEKPPLGLEAPLVLQVFFDHCQHAIETITTPKELKEYSYFIYKHAIFYDLTAELNFMDTAYNMWRWNEEEFNKKAPMYDFQNMLSKQVNGMIEPLRSITEPDMHLYKNGPYGVRWQGNIMRHFQKFKCYGDGVTAEDIEKFRQVPRSEIHSWAMAYLPGYVAGLYRDMVKYWGLSKTKWIDRNKKEWGFIDFLEDAPRVLPW